MENLGVGGVGGGEGAVFKQDILGDRALHIGFVFHPYPENVEPAVLKGAGGADAHGALDIGIFHHVVLVEGVEGDLTAGGEAGNRAVQADLHGGVGGIHLRDGCRAVILAGGHVVDGQLVPRI